MGLKIGQVGSKSRSLGQILEKPCVRCRGHIFSPILLKFSKNVCLNGTVHSSRSLLKSASCDGPICPRQICCTGIGRGNAADVSPRPQKISGNFTAGGKRSGLRRLCQGSRGKIRRDDCKFLYINICNFPHCFGNQKLILPLRPQHFRTIKCGYKLCQQGLLKLGCHETLYIILISYSLSYKFVDLSHI